MKSRFVIEKGHTSIEIVAETDQDKVMLSQFFPKSYDSWRIPAKHTRIWNPKVDSQGQVTSFMVQKAEFLNKDNLSKLGFDKQEFKYPLESGKGGIYYYYNYRHASTNTNIILIGNGTYKLFKGSGLRLEYFDKNGGVRVCNENGTLKILARVRTVEDLIRHIGTQK